MSVMKRTWNEINEIANIDIVQNPPQQLSSDPEVIRETYGRFSSCEKRLAEIAKPLKKFVDRAKEPNEDARFYGPKTNQEILEYHHQYQLLKQTINAELTRWLPSYLPLSEADEAERLIKEQKAREMEEMRRQAMLQLEKMEQGKIIQEQKRRERRRREMEAEKEERRQKEMQKEQTQAAEVDLVIDAVRKRKEEKLAKRKAMEDLVENAKGHTFSDAFKIILSQNPEAGVESSKRALTYILSNLIKHPETEEVRRVRVNNPRLQADLFRWNGGLECLVALGFELHDQSAPEVNNIDVQDANWFLIVEEPDMRTDMSGWEAWHNSFRYAINEVQNS